MSLRAEKLHRTPWQGVFYITGGGSEFLSEMLSTAGASKTVLEARVPYASGALEQLLGQAPEQACSDNTTRSLAMAAFQQAMKLGDEHTFGFSCSASLATDREKRGRHRAYIAIQTEQVTRTFAVSLEGNRADEEHTLVEQLWHALDIALDLNLKTPGTKRITNEHTEALSHWRKLILGEIVSHTASNHDGKLLFPGAFNPLHAGHEKMLAIAETKTGISGAYELSISNVDKPFLDYIEIDKRISQFNTPVWLTRLPTFLDKARQFPETHFVLGIDTLFRLNDPKYYGGTREREDAFVELVDLDCRFVVFGRATAEGFLSLEDVSGLPEEFLERVLEIKRTEFDEEISSTSLRSR